VAAGNEFPKLQLSRPLSGVGPAIERWTLDDDLLDSAALSGGTRVRIARPEGMTVVLGSGSDPAVELHLDACRRDDVAVLRRRGGGCAVLLDPGNVVISVVRAVGGIGGIQTHFRWISAWIAASLANAGFPGARRRGVSDLAIGERKIGGSCIFRRKDVLYYSTTLLVKPRIDLIERYIAHPPREPDYRRGRGHREFLWWLAAIDETATPESVQSTLSLELTPESLESFPRPPAEMVG
jgi:lipoate-protein ligase A